METTKKSLVYPVIFMLVLSFILTFLLAGLNEFTAPKVKLNQEIEVQGKILDVFKISPPSSSAEDINRTFEENIIVEDFEGDPLYIYQENSQPKAYAVPFSGPGLWGRIDGFIGVDAGLNKLTGIQFTEQSETPGLGARIESEEYRNQYRDVDISNADPGKIVASSPEGQIDTISGATQTSDSVLAMVNDDLTRFIQTMKGGN